MSHEKVACAAGAKPCKDVQDRKTNAPPGPGLPACDETAPARRQWWLGASNGRPTAARTGAARTASASAPTGQASHNADTAPPLSDLGGT
ncbi:MAG: hypothetical protein Q8M96_23140, partial [Rubrivivax sp.]|nr:hypothetical protein [Rubrivivax sp.]